MRIDAEHITESAARVRSERATVMSRASELLDELAHLATAIPEQRRVISPRLLATDGAAASLGVGRGRTRSDVEHAAE